MRVFLAVVAAVAQALAGDTARAEGWAADVRDRMPLLRSEDFCRGYPVTAEPIRTRIAVALQELVFQESSSHTSRKQSDWRIIQVSELKTSPHKG